MSIRHASCSCGQLRVTCRGEPIRLAVCHCRACQRRTGSAFGVQARFSLEQLTFEGHHSTYVRSGDSGGTSTFRFCPRCGTTVWWQLDGSPESAAVAIGCFADPTFPPPTISIYEERRHPWAQIACEEHLD